MKEEKHYTMKELPASEQPYEKCEQLGPEALSDAELLAIIIKSGTKGEKAMDVAYSLLNNDPSHPGLEGITHMHRNELMLHRGIGRVKAIQLTAVCELARRLNRRPFREKLNFSHPANVADFYMAELSHLMQEELHVMMLDTKNQMICEKLLTKGTINTSLIDAREIFACALKEHAVGIILVHNHPSGDVTPSREDLAATQRVHMAGDVIGIKLLDHIIIGQNSYSSLCESGQL